MVKGGGVKGFFGKTFCCMRNNIPETAANASEPAGVFTITQNQSNTNTEMTFEEAKEMAKNNRNNRRASAISYRSCTSSIGTFRSLSESSLQSVISKNTGNYDFYSIYSNNSHRTSFNSVTP